MVTTAMIRGFAVQGMTAIMGLMPMAEPALAELPLCIAEFATVDLAEATTDMMPIAGTVTLCTLQGIEAFTMAIDAITTLLPPQQEVDLVKSV